MNSQRTYYDTRGSETKQTDKKEAYQGSLSKRILIWTLVEISWLIGYFLMYLSTAAMCLAAVLNGMDNPTLSSDRFTKYTKPLPSLWDWIFGWSHLPVPVKNHIPNYTWPIMFAVGLFIFLYYCRNLWVLCIATGIYASIFGLTIWIGANYLGATL